MTTRAVRYDCDGVELEGVFASDPGMKGPRPGVAVFHDAWGVGANVKMRIKMLAELGYVAFAVDMFGSNIRPRTLAECRSQLDSLGLHPDLIRERAAAGLAALKGAPEVDSTRVAAIGYCFGGMSVLELARRGGECAAFVSFHGMLRTVQPAARGAIRGRLLVCHGSEDRFVPFAEVRDFQREMHLAAADCQIVTYVGAQHSFANPFASNNPGIEHHPQADRRSWEVMRLFLQEAFSAQ
jgi:dienelactone hydrolase